MKVIKVLQYHLIYYLQNAFILFLPTIFITIVFGSIQRHSVVNTHRLQDVGHKGNMVIIIRIVFFYFGSAQDTIYT